MIERLQKSSQIRKADAAKSQKADSDSKTTVYTIHGPVFIEGDHPKALSELMKIVEPSTTDAEAAEK